MNAILEKYRSSITPLNDSETTDEMLRLLMAVQVTAQQRYWIKSHELGYICVFKHEKFPGKVIEYVQGTQDDSVTTLYQGTLITDDISRIEETRKDLIGEIAHVLMALPSTVAVYDEGRERQTVLKELGTAQLMDVLAKFTHTDLATI